MADYVDSIPDEVELCPKCRSHVLWDLPAQGGLWCYRCGQRGNGLVYLKKESLVRRGIRINDRDAIREADFRFDDDVLVGAARLAAEVGRLKRRVFRLEEKAGFQKRGKKPAGRPKKTSHVT